MSYFIFIAFLIILGLSLGYAYHNFFAIKRKFLIKQVRSKLINQKFFSSIISDNTAEYLAKLPTKESRAILSYDILQWPKHIKDEATAEKLKFMLSGKNARGYKKDELFLLLSAQFAASEGLYEKAGSIIENIKKSKKQPEKATHDLVSAQTSLYEGDLETAVIKASAALKIFKKFNFLYEEGLTYFVIGSIYRISGMYDSADIMYRSALKVFKFLSADRNIGEVLGNMGMLLSAQQRYEEANDYFNQAISQYQSIKDKEGESFIINQKALTALLHQDFSLAQELSAKALKTHKSLKGKSLSEEIMARAAYLREDWKNVIEHSTAAAAGYKKSKNYAGAYESMYINAEALVRTDNLDKAEKLLREIIASDKRHKSCFHVANAYTLLGVIFFRRQDFERAEGIINQALKYELYNDRDKGAAVDYLNLSLIEKAKGNKAYAKKYMEQALDHALASDGKLYEMIKARLN